MYNSAPSRVCNALTYHIVRLESVNISSTGSSVSTIDLHYAETLTNLHCHSICVLDKYVAFLKRCIGLGSISQLDRFIANENALEVNYFIVYVLFW